jgi:predicted DNA-binding transcriptional regulator YafY
VRHVEPHRLVYTGRRWSLLAWDAFLTSLDLDFEVLDPPELRGYVRRLADRYRVAASGPTQRP